jgi:uncharacterized protein
MSHVQLKGDSDAVNDLALMCQNGQGAPQDFARAREWYMKAIEKGDSDALNNLGSMYHHGQGGPQEFARAREWHMKAIER